MDDRRREFPVRELLDCRLDGVEVIDIVSFLERETGRVHLDVLNPSWIIFADGFRRDALRQATKRAFDMARLAGAVLVTWPFMLLTMLAIMLEDGPRAPILYRQRRVGLDGRSSTCSSSAACASMPSATARRAGRRAATIASRASAASSASCASTSCRRSSTCCAAT